MLCSRGLYIISEIFKITVTHMRLHVRNRKSKTPLIRFRLQVILLLEGKAHAYVFASRGCKRWDTCAPEAVLHSIGGVLTDLYGERYPYNPETTYANTKGVLATAPGQSHQWYLSRIPDEVKQKLQ